MPETQEAELVGALLDSCCAHVLETDFLHLIQLMEFGAAGLFGGGIPKNPFREHEG